jgi:hypothetical protein
MSKYAFPAPVAPSGEPACALFEDHWANHWTVGDCIMHFDNVPTFFRLLDAATIVGNIWHVLTLTTKRQLEEAFTLYDIGTGRV